MNLFNTTDCTLKNGKMVNLMLCIFYHSKKYWKTADTQDSKMLSAVPVKEKKLMDIKTRECQAG